MPNAYWKLADKVLTSIKTTKTIPDGFFTSLTRRVGTSISNSSPEQLSAIKDGLEKVFNEAMGVVSNDVVRSLQNTALDEPVAAGYMLGQLSFAHQLVLATEGRTDDTAVFELVNSAKFRPYILELMKENLSGKNLADRCGLTVETVSRNLAELREHGVTDYRREGTSFVNFLTTAGRTIAERLPVSPKAESQLNSAKAKLRKNVASEFYAMPLLKKA